MPLTCNALNCRAPRQPQHFMCGGCWARVPVPLRKLALDAFMPLQAGDATAPQRGEAALAASVMVVANALVRGGLTHRSCAAPLEQAARQAGALGTDVLALLRRMRSACPGHLLPLRDAMDRLSDRRAL